MSGTTEGAPERPDEPTRPDEPERDAAYLAQFRRDYVAPDADAEAEPAPAPARREGIDSRYDPRFQRGYDAERHGVTRPSPETDRPVFSSSLKATATSPTRALPDAEPVPRRAAPQAGDVAPADTPPSPARQSGETSAALSPAASDGRNPFLIALWIVSAAFVVIGIVFIVQAAQNPTARFVASVAVGDVFARTAWTVAPICVTVGMAGLIALTLVHAVRWRPSTRHSTIDADDDADEEFR
jgi:hypothetical protein